MYIWICFSQFRLFPLRQWLHTQWVDNQSPGRSPAACGVGLCGLLLLLGGQPPEHASQPPKHRNIEIGWWRATNKKMRVKTRSPNSVERYDLREEQHRVVPLRHCTLQMS